MPRFRSPLANGNRTSLRRRDNWPQAYGDITYEYDALNRMTRKLVPQRPAPHPNPLDPSHTRDVYYGYDLRNLQTFARFDSPSGQGVTSAYDGFGRPLTSSINLGGTTRTLAYQHDRAGNRTRLTHPDSVQFNYSHDGLNRPVFVTDSAIALKPCLPLRGHDGGVRADRRLDRPADHAGRAAVDPASL